MALDDDDDDRTEEPSPRRLEQALREGDVPQSHELAQGLHLLAAAGVLTVCGADLLGQLGALLTRVLGEELARAPGHLDATGAAALLGGAARWAGSAAAPLLLALGLVAAGAPLVQRRPFIAAGRLAPRLDRFSPLRNLGRAFGGAGASELVVTALKVVLACAVVAHALREGLPQALAAAPTGLLAGAAAGTRVGLDLLTNGALALLVAGLIDLWLVRRRWLRGLRMTRAELRQEQREDEGDPHVRGRRRALQRSLRRRRGALEAVKTADVVVTNPIHVAVALRYDRATMAAPRVVAKGAELLCARIKELARREGVAVVEDRPLARALFRVEVGQHVPPALYQAVAEVLAFVYRLRGSGGAR